MFELDKLVKWFGDLIAQGVTALGLGSAWVTGIQLAIAALVVIAFASVVVLFLVWWERKVSARIQMRLGPMRVGWHGLLQTIADALKLLQKENITPATADRGIYFWAPIVTFVTALAVYVTIPFGRGLIVSDLNIGILYILSVTTFTVIGLLMAGWSSNNKYAMLGGFRSAAQVVSYEVPMALSILARDPVHPDAVHGRNCLAAVEILSMVCVPPAGRIPDLSGRRHRRVQPHAL